MGAGSPHERRTTRRAARVTDCGGRPSIRSTSARTAARPSSPVGWATAGDRRIGVHEPRDVVERRERDVLGNPQPARADRVQRAERHQVVGGEDDLGRLGQVEEALGDPPSALGLEVALTYVGVRERQSVFGHGLPEGLDVLAAGGGRRGPRDDREPAVSQPVQMRHEIPDRRPAVRPYDGHVHARDPAVHEDHRRPRTRGVQHPGEPPSAGETSSPSIRRSSRVRTWWSWRSGRSSALPMITL